MDFWVSFSDEMRKMAAGDPGATGPGADSPDSIPKTKEQNNREKEGYRSRLSEPEVAARVAKRHAAKAARETKAFPNTLLRIARKPPSRRTGMILAGLAGLFGGGALGYRLGKKDKAEGKEATNESA